MTEKDIREQDLCFHCLFFDGMDEEQYSNLSQILYNLSNNINLIDDNERLLVLPWWQSMIWSCIFSALIVVAVGGNLIVMWIVLAHRRMWTVTNYFLVNLSLSDILLAVFNCIFNFAYMLNNDWPFGETYCRISNFVANLTVAASVFTLTATSFDRYLAIVKPLQPRMSRRNAWIVIAVIWTASSLLALPCLLYSAIHSYSDNETDRRACIVIWPDGYPHESFMDYIYNLIILAMTYVIPMIGMGICYTVIGRVLWGGGQIGELNQRHLETLKSKRKVVRMFIVLVSFFALCWLPYHLYFISINHDFRIARYRYIQHIYLAFYWLAMSNSMINPLIYYCLNARFRNYFRRLICCITFSKWRSSTLKRQMSSEVPLRSMALNGLHHQQLAERTAVGRPRRQGSVDH